MLPVSPHGVCGFRPSIHKATTLHVARYMEPRMYDAPPPSEDCGMPKLQIFGNDRYGNCTFAALAHMIQQRCALLGIPCTLTAEIVVAAYLDFTGGADSGCMPIDVLTHVRSVGLGGYLKGMKFARVNVQDPVELRAGLHAFRYVYFGASLPKRINTQGAAWKLLPVAQRTADDERGSLGGHAFGVSAAERGALGAWPWIDNTTLDDEWTAAYVDEGWICLDDMLATSSRIAPQGFDLVRLERDLDAIGQP